MSGGGMLSLTELFVEACYLHPKFWPLQSHMVLNYRISRRSTGLMIHSNISTISIPS
ncbi:hypothetical protein KSP40_PGU007549 [Platanthera guangdongensis]|uniref:Uncharacterized protein n=1 Tax=Platanthera guangdongensis TaxID=2320717 RepID=A0ABR2MS04_9ASPA